MSEATNNGPGPKSPKRRKLLTLTGLTGLGGLAIASWPFLRSLLPSRRAQVLGAPVQLDVSKLEPGEQLTAEWRGQPIWVLKRDDAMLRTLASENLLDRLRDPDSEVRTQQPGYAQNELRSLKSEYFVCIAVCTHLGCVPVYRPERGAPEIDPDWQGGYFCPCHRSKFDLAGRVYKGVPAPTNLVIPPHNYVDEKTLVIGIDQEQT